MSNFISSFFDWILTHLVALVFSLFLAIAVIGQAPLLGWSPVDEGVQPPVVPEQGVSDTPAPSQEVATETQPEPALAPESESEPVVSSTDAEVSAAEADSVFRPTEPVSSDHQQFVPVDLVKKAKRAERGEPEVPVDTIDPAGLLQQARMAFWEGSLEKAEMMYLRYLSLKPEDANGFGELGNLYQSMGRPEDALDAYLEAGVRFKANGDREQLEQIVDLLSEAKDPRLGKLLQ